MSTPIRREEIRKGDKIRSTFTEEFTASSDTIAHETGFTYELIERPVTLPTVPGIYADAYGYPWILHPEVPNCAQHWRLDTDFMTDTDARGFAPFTPLRPVAEVAAEVLDEVRALVYPGSFLSDQTAALAKRWAAK